MNIPILPLSCHASPFFSWRFTCVDYMLYNFTLMKGSAYPHNYIAIHDILIHEIKTVHVCMVVIVLLKHSVNVTDRG